MRFSIEYVCLTHIGKIRQMNQDNFICEGKYLRPDGEALPFPLTGVLQTDRPSMLGVFDGMGGEECGEVASLIAAECAAGFRIEDRPVEDLLTFCKLANEEICKYAEENDVSTMGTTAALLAFTGRGIALCNIGDSKIFRFAENRLEQLSVDHYAFAPFGRKPPLSQSLGIPADEMVIEPYTASRSYSDGEIYLLCSDGLTDMVTPEEISGILRQTPFDTAAGKLLSDALEHGGKDNVTIILCRIKRERRGLLNRLFRSKKAKGDQDNVEK